jgi:hypothetical protein
MGATLRDTKGHKKFTCPGQLVFSGSRFSLHNDISNLHYLLFSPLNLMLWVSVSPGRDRACRHGRIPFLLDPLGKAATIFLIFV